MAQQSGVGKEFRARIEKVLSSEAECQKFAEALEVLANSPQRAFRWNPLRAGAESFLRSELVDWRPVPWASGGVWVGEADARRLHASPAAGAALFFGQEPGAMEVVGLLNPQPGEQCLDLCAAPGAKSTQVAECLGGKGWLVANEFVRSRAAKLDALLARHGAPNVSVTSLEAEKIAAFYPATFDAVLVDAPCSGESLLAKRSDERSDIKDSDVRGCARRQLRILLEAAGALRPGGRMVYSTCTYSRDENEDVVALFLEKHPDFKLARELRRWPHIDGVPGGYAALLISTLPAGAARALEVREAGLLRHGLERWDGARDLYAAAMVPECTSDFAESVPLSDAEAEKFLRGESLACPQLSGASRLVRLEWRGWPLGHGKFVESRINNQLPKILRNL
ncbi:MAG: hypothetical protein JST16_18700 [Bdellovibrionales bacterium]|nr:hypothetical protein [Bdellovibrionales bacterium]